MGEPENQTPLSRCAFCQRSGVFLSMLWCSMCKATFCRGDSTGDCHALYHASRWDRMREQQRRA